MYTFEVVTQDQKTANLSPTALRKFRTLHAMLDHFERHNGEAESDTTIQTEETALVLPFRRQILRELEWFMYAVDTENEEVSDEPAVLKAICQRWWLTNLFSDVMQAASYLEYHEVIEAGTVFMANRLEGTHSVSEIRKMIGVDFDDSRSDNLRRVEATLLIDNMLNEIK